MKAGAYSPNLKAPALHALSSDDVPLHFDMDNLTDKQQQDHYLMCTLVAMLQVCLIGISKPEDYIALFDGHDLPHFREILERYHALMTQVGFDVVPRDHLITAPAERFYETLAEKLPPVEYVNFLMMSRSNENIHGNQEAIARNLKLNSKYHFAQNAPGFGIPTPETLSVSPTLAGNRAVESLFERHNGQIMLKMTGMPGGRNVVAVSSVEEADNVLAEVYPGATEVVLQQKLDLNDYDEWTVDLLVADDAITIDNCRHILIADGVWVGNHMPPASPLTEQQEAVLLKVGEYARSFGHGSPEGDNLGIDFFIGKEGDLIVTEINPRWTAGLLPSHVLKQLGKTGQHAIGYFDMVAMDLYPDYLDYVERRLPGTGERGFDVMPLGFSPFDLEVDGRNVLNVWLLVRGDFAAFRNEVRETFGPGNFPAADLIPVEALTA